MRKPHLRRVFRFWFLALQGRRGERSAPDAGRWSCPTSFRCPGTGPARRPRGGPGAVVWVFGTGLFALESSVHPHAPSRLTTFKTPGCLVPLRRARLQVVAPPGPAPGEATTAFAAAEVDRLFYGLEMALYLVLASNMYQSRDAHVNGRDGKPAAAGRGVVKAMGGRFGQAADRCDQGAHPDPFLPPRNASATSKSLAQASANDLKVAGAASLSGGLCGGRRRRTRRSSRWCGSPPWAASRPCSTPWPSTLCPFPSSSS
jgi:hypothetical protein